MNQQGWDIFTASNAAGSFWAGMQLAQQLVQAGAPVRLFTDCIETEATRWHRVVNPDSKELWGDFGVFERAAAAREAPAVQSVQVWGATAPSQYLERVWAEGREHVCVNLDSPTTDACLLRPINVLTQQAGWRELALQMGSGPRFAGYLKPELSALRVPRVKEVLRQRLELLARWGMDKTVPRSGFFVMMSAEADFDPVPVVTMLRDTRRPTVLVIERGPVQVRLASTFGVPVEGQGALMLGDLTILFVHELSWADQEACMAACDLIISSELSLCWRAACMGIPLIVALEGQDQTNFLDWYCDGPISSPHVLLKHLGAKLFHSQDLPEAWSWYWSCLPDFEDHAFEVRQRVLAGNDLVQTLREAMQHELLDARPTHLGP